MNLVPDDLDDYLARLRPHRRQRTTLRLALCASASSCAEGLGDAEGSPADSPMSGEADRAR